MNKWSILDAKYTDSNGAERSVFDPHSGQLRFMEDPAQFLCATCGRRMGKSTFTAKEFIPEAIITKNMASYLLEEGKRREFWSVGPNYSDSEKPFRTFYNDCKRLGMEFDKPGTYYSLEGGDMTVSLWGGAFIYSAKSSAMPERLVGEALSGVHMEEAAKQKQSTWTQYIQPALMDNAGWAKFTTTPEGKNWYYDLHMKALRPSNLGWNAHRIPSWYNPYVYTVTGREITAGRLPRDTPIPPHEMTLDKDVARLIHLMYENPHLTSFELIQSEGFQIDPGIAQLANDQTLAEFQQEIAGEFTDFVGRVFGDFQEETHVRELPFMHGGGWKTYAAVDYGYRNPNVWLLIQVGPWGEINVVDELYQADLTADDFAKEILRRGLCPDSLLEFYPDPASPGDSRILEKIFRVNGKRARARPHTGGEIDNRLNLIRLALKQRVVDTELAAPTWLEPTVQPDPRRPRLMVSTKCPKTIFEFIEYRYPKTRDEQTETSTKRYESPMKLNDHTPEALGRFLAGKYHSAADQHGGGTRISHGQFLNGLGKRSAHPGGYDQAPAGIPVRRTSKSRGSWAGSR